MADMKPVFVVAFASGLIACLGCQNPLGRCVSERHLLRSGKYVLIKGIHVPSIDDPRGCGAQALSSVMSFLDPRSPSSDIYESLPIRGQPCTPIELLLTARAKHYKAKVSKGAWADLKQEIDEGSPSLVMFDRASRMWSPLAWPKQPQSFHWSVVSGMSRNEDAILLAAPNRKHYVVGKQVFQERWSTTKNCTITIHSPEDEGATAGRGRVRGTAADGAGGVPLHASNGARRKD